jgi:ribosomal protein L27
MTKVGHTTKKFYRETRGIKVTGGQSVQAGTVLTRQGDRWRPGKNVIGQIHLTAACDGEIYFTRKKGSYKKLLTVINIRPQSAKAAKKKEAKQTSEHKAE